MDEIQSTKIALKILREKYMSYFGLWRLIEVKALNFIKSKEEDVSQIDRAIPQE